MVLNDELSKDVEHAFMTIFEVTLTSFAWRNWGKSP